MENKITGAKIQVSGIMDDAVKFVADNQLKDRISWQNTNTQWAWALVK